MEQKAHSLWVRRMDGEGDEPQPNERNKRETKSRGEWLAAHPTSCLSRPCRRRVRKTALAAHARAQAGGEDDQGADCAQREATAHPADMLRRQPAARRAHEGAASGDDWLKPTGHPRVVPEQAL